MYASSPQILEKKICAQQIVDTIYVCILKEKR